MKDRWRIQPAGSGSDHGENHLEPGNRFECMWLACWHENDFAAMQAMRLSGNHNFCFAIHDLHQCVERSSVFAQSLILVESEDRHAARRLLDDLSADDRAFLVADEFSDLGWLARRESFG